MVTEMTKMKDIIETMSNYVVNSGYSVDWSNSNGWVAIHNNNTEQDEFFIEESDFDEYIETATDYAMQADVHMETAMNAVAKQYIDCI